MQRPGFDPWVGNVPWRRIWIPTPVLLSGESHGQRGLAGYSPQGHKESNMTEVTWHAHTQRYMTPKNDSELHPFAINSNFGTRGKICMESYGLDGSSTSVLIY